MKKGDVIITKNSAEELIEKIYATVEKTRLHKIRKGKRVFLYWERKEYGSVKNVTFELINGHELYICFDKKPHDSCMLYDLGDTCPDTDPRILENRSLIADFVHVYDFAAENVPDPLTNDAALLGSLEDLLASSRDISYPIPYNPSFMHFDETL